MLIIRLLAIVLLGWARKVDGLAVQVAEPCEYRACYRVRIRIYRMRYCELLCSRAHQKLCRGAGCGWYDDFVRPRWVVRFGFAAR